MSRYRDSSSPEDRGRSTIRKSTGLSNYYRDRFGSQSPEEYTNLRISGFDDRLERDEIKQLLTEELRKFSPFEIKVVRNPGDNERLAYVNFDTRGYAKRVRNDMMDRLRRSLGRHVLCDPAGILRDQEGKFIPDRFNRQQLQTNDSGRRRSPDRGSGGQRRGGGANFRLNQDDTEATRTLFVGNMPADIRESEIRRAFERFGRVEDVDIKTPANTDAAYAFVMFQTLHQAIDAKHGMHDCPVRQGTSRSKIGYGKSQVTRRLWVGGLGLWTTTDMLAREFDRYGIIDKLEYERLRKLATFTGFDHRSLEDGDEFAYIRFKDADAAQDACKAMRDFPLGGLGRLISVDFAKDDSGSNGSGGARKRRATQSPPGGPRTPPDSPKPTIRTFEQLDDEFASTWHGNVILKKAEYGVKLYRIAGSERLLQKLMRDEDGNSIKLPMTQRLALSNQDSLLDRLTSASSKQSSFMVAVGKKDGNLSQLIKYLVEKDAAGVVQLSDAVVYIFPYSAIVTRLCAHWAPHVRIITEGCPYLLFALGLKAPSGQSSPR